VRPDVISDHRRINGRPQPRVDEQRGKAGAAALSSRPTRAPCMATNRLSNWTFGI
jgi:hypothetical protein